MLGVQAVRGTDAAYRIVPVGERELGAFPRPALAPSIEIRRSLLVEPLAPRPALDEPIRLDVAVPCNESDLAAVGGDASRLRLARYDAQGRLLMLPTSVEGMCQLVGEVEGPSALQLVALVGEPTRLDYPIDGAGRARFYTQTSGLPGFAGYSLRDDAEAAMLSAYEALGGADRLGYPMSERFLLDGAPSQLTERALLQWVPERGEARIVDLLDRLHAEGRDRALDDFWQVPARGSWAGDVDPTVLAALEGALRADPSRASLFGEPVALGRYADRVVLRTPSTAFAYWLIDGPNVRAGEVTAVEVGAISLALGLWPSDAVTAEAAPPPAQEE